MNGIGTPLLMDYMRANSDQAVFERVWRQIEADVERQRARTLEFPLTAMSRCLGEAIWKSSFLPENLEESAFDVGTGTGCHAMLMAGRGFRRVLGIDPSVAAISHACSRAERLLPLLFESALTSCSEVSFRAMSLDEMTGEGSEKYALITFNPPAYYDLQQTQHATPAAQGVYVDDSGDTFKNSQSSLLYRFFKNIVIPLLGPGGHVLCTWPGLERRVVERNPSSTSLGPIVHPFELIENWFGLKIHGDRRVPDAFFCQSATIGSDYGLGDVFWKNLEDGYNSGLYSKLVQRDDKGGHLFSFSFGVIHLVRLPGPGLSFRSVDLELPLKRGD